MTRRQTIPDPFTGGNAKQRRKERRSGTTYTTWRIVSKKGALK